MPLGGPLAEVDHMEGIRARFSHRLTSRRGAWLSIAGAVLVFVALFGLFGRSEAPTGVDHAPSDSESARVAKLLKEFPGGDRQSVLVVASRNDAGNLTAGDVAALKDLAITLDEHTDLTASEPLVSDDGAAAVVITPITIGADNTATARIVEDLRAEVADHTPTGLELLVTGGPAFGADVTSSFDGADFTLLAVTIAIVAILLVLTYRSPILWLIPLVVVGAADRLATGVTAAIGNAMDLQFDAGIISVLVFGAGTNYALLLISRYREELLVDGEHRHALASAWRNTVPAIFASNVTVVLALLTLTLAVIPGTRGLGISSAAGLIIALAAVLFVLPPLLAVCGPTVFWPFIPKADAAAVHGGVWRAVATRVVQRPLVGLTAGIGVLVVMSVGLIGTSIGLNQLDKFRVPSESAAGLEVLSQHFPPGESQPIFVVAATSATESIVDATADVDGVIRAHPVEQTADGKLTQIMVTGEYAPGTPESLDLVTELREAVHAVHGADALVGGAVATDLDARSGNQQDLVVIPPLVLAAGFIVLVVLLRSLLAPVLLLMVNIASTIAAIGVGAWLSRVLFDQPALDLQVPLLSFLFLVALGIDYTIFLVHRARGEAARHGEREGMIRAVAGTGSVITSAGIVLAAVFAALGVLPLVTLGQLGLIVGVGVIVDALIVRTVIVPSLFSLLGDRVRGAQPPHDDGESKHAQHLNALAE